MPWTICGMGHRADTRRNRPWRSLLTFGLNVHEETIAVAVLRPRASECDERVITNMPAAFTGPLAESVARLRAFRGIDTLTATVILTKTGKAHVRRVLTRGRLGLPSPARSARQVGDAPAGATARAAREGLHVGTLEPVR
jgi:hypothetical protein